MQTREDLQTAIFNNIPDMAWLKDKKSRYLAVNEAYVKASGRAEKDLLGRGPREVWPKEWAEVYLKTDREVIGTGKRKRYEEQRYDHNGTLRWFDTIKTPFRNARGEIVGTTGISRDITERKHAAEELARFNRFYAVRSQTNQAIARLSDRDELLDQTCRIIRRSGGVEAAFILLFDEEGADQARLVAHSPRHAGKLGRMAEKSSGSNLAKFRRAGARPWICDDTRAATRFVELAQLAHELGYFSCAFFPLKQAKNAVGVFMLFAPDAQFFSGEIVQLLSELTADLSFALSSIQEAQRRQEAERELRESRQQLRELSAFLEAVREEERSRISRELHDELGQTLTALTMGLQWAGKRLPPAQEKVRAKLDALKGLTETTAFAMRRIASDLRPLVLDELGLPSAIEWLIESFAEGNSIDIQLKSDLRTTNLGAPINTAFFRILQESLTNVSRHGQATRVLVEVLEGDRFVTLRIRDNGRGIDRVAAASGKKLGLIGMRERAYMLGGTFNISSEKAAGTAIEVTLPKTTTGKGRAS